MPLEKLKIAASTSIQPPNTISVASLGLRRARSPAKAVMPSAISPRSANGSSHAAWSLSADLNSRSGPGDLAENSGVASLPLGRYLDVGGGVTGSGFSASLVLAA